MKPKIIFGIIAIFTLALILFISLASAVNTEVQKSTLIEENNGCQTNADMDGECPIYTAQNETNDTSQNDTSQDGNGFEIVTENFAPKVWQCAESRIVYDDLTEPGRNLFYKEEKVNGEDGILGEELVERINDYAFEGEQIQWRVLVMDKNGIEKIGDVYVTVDNKTEANCMLLHSPVQEECPNNDCITETDIITDSVIINTMRLDPSCNARIDEEILTEFDQETMAYYLCTLTVETPESMYGEKDITVEAEDIDGKLGDMAETERWFLNPVIQLLINEEISFHDVWPGTTSYSDMVLVKNNADSNSGVMLDMFISGADFYDSTSSGAKCSETNQLNLGAFNYYASKGAYTTKKDMEVGRSCDSEGYCAINYGIGFNDPNPFYNKNEIIQSQKVGPYYTANLLSPGSEIAIIFKLELPEPCNGDFDSGSIYFWGEAV